MSSSYRYGVMKSSQTLTPIHKILLFIFILFLVALALWVVAVLWLRMRSPASARFYFSLGAAIMMTFAFCLFGGDGVAELTAKLPSMQGLPFIGDSQWKLGGSIVVGVVIFFLCYYFFPTEPPPTATISNIPSVSQEKDGGFKITFDYLVLNLPKEDELTAEVARDLGFANLVRTMALSSQSPKGIVFIKNPGARTVWLRVVTHDPITGQTTEGKASG